MSEVRRIAHVDMDAFFASCELSVYPELRGLPMVVGGGQQHAPTIRPDGTREFVRLHSYTGRGVLTTATYEARAFGVHSGMPTMKAARLAPDAVLLPVNFPLYRHHSQLFKQAVRSVCSTVQDIGIDEVYVDVSDLLEDSKQVAKAIQDAVWSETGLTCSVGIAPNKLLAKLCSDLQKPKGITVLTMDDVRPRLWPLAASKINGIGPKATIKLEAIGLRTIGEVAQADIALLQTHFGPNYAAWLHRVAHGIDSRPLATSHVAKSISRETTFERNMHVRRDRETLSKILDELCSKLGDDLERKQCRARTIGVKLRFDDFKTVTRDSSVPSPIDDRTSIRRHASECLKRIEFDRTIRLLGVRASSLEPADDKKTLEPSQATLNFE